MITVYLTVVVETNNQFRDHKEFREILADLLGQGKLGCNPPFNVDLHMVVVDRSWLDLFCLMPPPKFRGAWLRFLTVIVRADESPEEIDRLINKASRTSQLDQMAIVVTADRASSQWRGGRIRRIEVAKPCWDVEMVLSKIFRFIDEHLSQPTVNRYLNHHEHALM